MMSELLRGPWLLKDLKAGLVGLPQNGLKVFSCFHCGGGSTMGYKLAGFELLGGVDIDPEMMNLYRHNHNPRHSYLMGVQDFNLIPDADIPEELFNLDILDGSPPCSSFSMAGSREDAWGENKKFREGQATQVLDDLFFHFIETAKKLQPKVVIAENVKGLVIGKARGYVKDIFRALDKAGYDTQLFLLNSARMGVPQARERTFFVARRKDLKLPKLEMNFSEPIITVGEALAGLPDQSHIGKKLTEETRKLWGMVFPGDCLSKAHEKGHRFNAYKCDPNKPAKTLSAGSDANPMRWDEPRRFSTLECGRIQTFPDDYFYGNMTDNYVCGMSVPPYMMMRVSNQVAIQVFGKTPASL